MTGYGNSKAEIKNKKITVEIKSLNSKIFDLSTKIPFSYREKKIEIKNLLSKLLVRGKIDLYINIESISEEIPSKVNYNIIKQYHREIVNISKHINIEEPKEWFPMLLNLPGSIDSNTDDEMPEEEWQVIKKAIEEAVYNINSFRNQEGIMLSNLIKEKINKIETLLKEIEPFESERIEKIKSKFIEGISKFKNLDISENRLEQELIFYIEKLDINEEKTRLQNHIKYFIETIDNEINQGKKLGFISQEISREINTLGSKCNHSGIQRIVVEMKDELEQIKEQILNIL